MAVTSDTLWNMPRLNKLFAVSSLALLGSTVWMVWDDDQRAWKDHQTDYMNTQAGLYHLEALMMQTDEKRKELESARAKVEEARAAVAAQAERVAAIRREQNESAGRLAGLNLQVGNLSSEIQVTRAFYEEAKTLHGAESHEALEWKHRLEAQHEELDERRRQRDQIDDNNRELDRELKEILKPQTEAQKEYDHLVREGQEALARSEEYASGLRRTAFNVPLMDFAAPKGTIGRFEIRQQVLPDVRLDVNFMDTYVTDRCQTCHAAIDDPRFTRQGLRETFEKSAEAINQELARQGKPPLPFPLPPPAGGLNRPSEPGAEVSQEAADEYFHQLHQQVNRYLADAGLPAVHVDQPLLAHPDLDLYVTSDSPHPMSKMGCTSCHEGAGFETEFILAAHTPVDHETMEEWEHKYLRPYGATDFHTVEHYWDYPMTLPKYVESNCVKCHSRVADMLFYQGDPIAERINEGRYLFGAVGCADCHLVKGSEDARRVGPDLTHVSSKLSPEFMREWIHFPKKYRPSTWMPHFFQQENNDELSERREDPDPIARTRAETVAIGFYLEKVSRPFAPEPIPPDLSGDAENGRKLFGSLGCLGCHNALAHRPEAGGPTLGQTWITDDLIVREGLSADEADSRYKAMTHADQVLYAMKHFKNERETVFDPKNVGKTPMFTRFAPELSSLATKFSGADQGLSWLYDWLRNPRHYSSYTKMPSLRLTPTEALDVAGYLMTLQANESFDRLVQESSLRLDEGSREQLDELMNLMLRGQNSASRTRDIMLDVGGELSGMLVTGLRKSLGDDQAEGLVAALDTADKRVLYVGSKMIGHYGCYACHLIPGFEDTTRPGTELSEWGVKPLSQIDFGFYDLAFDSQRGEEFDKLYPPDRPELIHWTNQENPDQKIMHTRASFAWHKMRNPRIWDRKKIKDPLTKLKMPNFYFTDKEADALVTYLLSRRPAMIRGPLKVDYDNTDLGPIAAGRLLSRELNCVGCHKIEANEAPMHQYIFTEEGGERVFVETDAPPWLRGQGAKVQHAWFYEFLQNVEALRPWLKVRMPSFYLTNEQATTLVRYFAALSNDESRWLSEQIEPVAKYIQKAHEPPAGGLNQGSAPGLVDIARIERDDVDYEARPGDDWYEQASLARQREALLSYAVENRLIHPSELEPFDPDDPEDVHRTLGKAHRKILSQAAFLRDLYGVEYPFVFSGLPAMSAEGLERGEKLLYELQCLSCHVFGDPTVPGAHPNPTAPNLNLTHRRLRPEWALAWLKGPARIQPGTKMPVLWPGGQSAFAEFPEADRVALEGAYGDTGIEQMELVRDLLYQAGRQSRTLVQPGAAERQAAAQAAAESGDEEEEVDDEEIQEEMEEEQ